MFLEDNIIAEQKSQKVREKNGFAQKKMQSTWGGENQRDRNK